MAGRLYPKIKRPGATLDFLFDWQDYCVECRDALADYSIVADQGVEVIKDERIGNTVRVWVTGGQVGKIYNVKCSIETAGFGEDKRYDERIMPIRVRV